MPSLGADMDAGTLVEWLVKPGDLVKRGDIVAVVETEKGAIEIEIFEAGKVDELLVAIGATVPVGTPLALVGGAKLETPAKPAPEIVAKPPITPTRPEAIPAAAPSGASDSRMLCRDT